jgi:hypothetical protein
MIYGLDASTFTKFPEEAMPLDFGYFDYAHGIWWKEDLDHAQPAATQIVSRAASWEPGQAKTWRCLDKL